MTVISERFRGFLPVVIDIETGGFNHQTDAILEIAAVTLHMTNKGLLAPKATHSFNVEPFTGANIETASLEVTGIDPFDPNRSAIAEDIAIKEIFNLIKQDIKEYECTRAILVGHNAFFDLNFINAAINRHKIKRGPFHPFSCFDTATLAGLAVGQTVLEYACLKTNIIFNKEEAHSAIYDAEKTAELFCYIVNRWQALGGWES